MSFGSRSIATLLAMSVLVQDIGWSDSLPKNTSHAPASFSQQALASPAIGVISLLAPLKINRKAFVNRATIGLRKSAPALTTLALYSMLQTAAHAQHARSAGILFSSASPSHATFGIFATAFVIVALSTLIPPQNSDRAEAASHSTLLAQTLRAWASRYGYALPEDQAQALAEVLIDRNDARLELYWDSQPSVIEGAPGKHAYLLLPDETVTVVGHATPFSPKPTTLAELSGPEFFGQVGLLYQIPRTATVRPGGLRVVKVFSFSEEGFVKLLEEMPLGLQRAVTQNARRIVRLTSQKIADERAQMPHARGLIAMVYHGPDGTMTPESTLTLADFSTWLKGILRLDSTLTLTRRLRKLIWDRFVDAHGLAEIFDREGSQAGYAATSRIYAEEGLRVNKKGLVHFFREDSFEPQQNMVGLNRVVRLLNRNHPFSLSWAAAGWGLGNLQNPRPAFRLDLDQAGDWGGRHLNEGTVDHTIPRTRFLALALPPSEVSLFLSQAVQPSSVVQTVWDIPIIAASPRVNDTHYLVIPDLMHPGGYWSVEEKDVVRWLVYEQVPITEPDFAEWTRLQSTIEQALRKKALGRIVRDFLPLLDWYVARGLPRARRLLPEIAQAFIRHASQEEINQAFDYFEPSGSLWQDRLTSLSGQIVQAMMNEAQLGKRLRHEAMDALFARLIKDKPWESGLCDDRQLSQIISIFAEQGGRQEIEALLEDTKPFLHLPRLAGTSWQMARAYGRWVYSEDTPGEALSFLRASEVDLRVDGAVKANWGGFTAGLLERLDSRSLRSLGTQPQIWSRPQQKVSVQRQIQEWNHGDWTYLGLAGRTAMFEDGSGAVYGAKILRPSEPESILKAEAEKLSRLNSLTSMSYDVQSIERISRNSLPGALTNDLPVEFNGQILTVMIYQVKGAEPLTQWSYLGDSTIDPEQFTAVIYRAIATLAIWARHNLFHTDLVALFHLREKKLARLYNWAVDVGQSSAEIRSGAGHIAGGVDATLFGNLRNRPKDSNPVVDVPNVESLYDINEQNLSRFWDINQDTLPTWILRPIHGAHAMRLLGDYLLAITLTHARYWRDRGELNWQDDAALDRQATALRKIFQTLYIRYVQERASSPLKEEQEATLSNLSAAVDWRLMARQIAFYVGKGYLQGNENLPEGLYPVTPGGDGWGFIAGNIIRNRIERYSDMSSADVLKNYFVRPVPEFKDRVIRPDVFIFVPNFHKKLQREKDTVLRKALTELYQDYSQGWRWDGVHEDLGPINGPCPLIELIRAIHLFAPSMLLARFRIFTKLVPSSPRPKVAVSASA